MRTKYFSNKISNLFNPKNNLCFNATDKNAYKESSTSYAYDNKENCRLLTLKPLDCVEVKIVRRYFNSFILLIAIG